MAYYPTLPSRFQFEPSSGSTYASQVFNCSVTVMTAIKQQYRGNWYGIEATRTNAGVPRGRPATYNENQHMLAVGGVPAQVRVIDSLAELRALVAVKPVAVGVYMARVPSSVRGHSFTDWHMLGVRSLVGTTGFDVLDPNFSPPGGHRPDPTNGHRYYSNAVMEWAFIRGDRKLAIVPDNRPPAAPSPYPDGFPRRGYVAKGVTAYYLDGRYHHTSPIAGGYTFIGSKMLAGIRFLVYPTGRVGRVMFRSSDVRWL